jgi:phospholipase/carboxylesterase
MSINAEIWKGHASSEIEDMLKGLDLSDKAKVPISPSVGPIAGTSVGTGSRASSDKKGDNKPLVILMHGWGSNEADLPGVMSAINQDMAKLGVKHLPNWVSLRAPIPIDGSIDDSYTPTFKKKPDESIGGFYWFKHPVPDDLPLLQSLAYERGTEVIDWILNQIADGKIGENQPLIFLGFSQGAVMTTHLITRPELSGKIVAGVSLSGYLPFQDDFIPKFKIGAKIFHGWGNVDEIVSPGYSNKVSAWFTKNTSVVDKQYPDLVHSINWQEVADIAKFLEQFYIS